MMIEMLDNNVIFVSVIFFMQQECVNNLRIFFKQIDVKNRLIVELMENFQIGYR